MIRNQLKEKLEEQQEEQRKVYGNRQNVYH